MGLLLPNLDVVMTVLGETPANWNGAVDAHNHVWIAPVAGAAQGSPILDRFEPILTELGNYYAAGGRGIVDCQPGGCGRDVHQLAALSELSRVHIVCCSGFHRHRYYPPGTSFWVLGSEKLADFFTNEIQIGVEETIQSSSPIRAGFLKVAIEASLIETPQALLEGATIASVRTGSAIEVHTEKGADAEKVLDYFIRQGVNPEKVILCHMDKRPDFNLHQELADAGALLEYDTFYRPQYHPEQNLWPLLLKMISSGHEKAVALATDMADANLWSSMGRGPGLKGFRSIIDARLEQECIPANIIDRLLGANILSRLAKPPLNIKR